MVSVVKMVQQSVSWQNTSRSTDEVLGRKSSHISRKVALIEFTFVMPGRVPEIKKASDARSRIR